MIETVSENVMAHSDRAISPLDRFNDFLDSLRRLRLLDVDTTTWPLELQTVSSLGKLTLARESRAVCDSDGAVEGSEFVATSITVHILRGTDDEAVAELSLYQEADGRYWAAYDAPAFDEFVVEGFLGAGEQVLAAHLAAAERPDVKQVA